MSAQGGRFAIVAAMVAVYIALPGHPELPAHGLPLGAAGTVMLSVAVLLAAFLRAVRLRRAIFLSSIAAIVALATMRVAIGGAASPVGWTARYYANAQGAGTPEWSLDFPRLGATRIDRRISFHDDTFPAHYLNDYTFERGDRREVTEPMTVDWTGFTFLDGERSARLSLAARGDAMIRVDGRPVVVVSSAKQPGNAGATVALSPGAHTLAVRYVKPPDTDGLVDVTALAAGSSGRSTPIAVSPIPVERAATRDWLRTAAMTIDGVLLAGFLCLTLSAGWTQWREAARRSSRAVAIAVFVLFGTQGWWQASRFAGRVVPLTAGDDWFGFESCAREILRHGLLMPKGRPLGEGLAYFYHPLYCYFLAAVHWITGESFFGPVFVQFLILAIVAVLVWQLATELFGELPAIAGLAVLIVVLELDFTRYYTVALLSENLYILTVTLTIVAFVRWIRRGRRVDLLWTGVWGGVSSITRPPMMLYLLPALALIALVAGARTRSLKGRAGAVALVAAAWLAMIAPITLRNWVVAHRFVLISDVPAVSVLRYNIPPSVDPAAYSAPSSATAGSIVRMLARMAREHPLAMMGVQVRKLGFSLGMIQWGPGYRPHPELIAVTVLYLVVLALSRRMRDRVLWPVHLFVVTHLASMSLTMPWNYGYRLIIPPFVYTSILSVAAVSAWLVERLSTDHVLHAAGSRV